MMRAVLFVCFAVCAFGLVIPDYTGYTFEKFVTEFHKHYHTQESRAIHMKQFEQNLESIIKHNAQVGITYARGVNKFTDLSDHEMKHFKGYLPGAHRQRVRNISAAKKGIRKVELPASVDWRKKGAVTAVKDQGQCGSCWAHSAVESIESHLFIETGTLLTLSPQNLMSCAPDPNHCGGTGGCDGGLPDVGFSWAEGGIALDSLDPYLGRVNQCDASLKKAAKVGGMVDLGENDGDALLNALATAGPVSVIVDASAWNSYHSGIFTGCAANPSLDHAVQAVGYGVDGTNQYWIVRNSWGPSWGEDGFIRLYRGPNESCGTFDVPSSIFCRNETSPLKVCGSCGMWYDMSYPTKLSLEN